MWGEERLEALERLKRGARERELERGAAELVVDYKRRGRRAFHWTVGLGVIVGCIVTTKGHCVLLVQRDKTKLAAFGLRPSAIISHSARTTRGQGACGKDDADLPAEASVGLDRQGLFVLGETGGTGRGGLAEPGGIEAVPARREPKNQR